MADVQAASAQEAEKDKLVPSSDQETDKTPDRDAVTDEELQGLRRQLQEQKDRARAAETRAGEESKRSRSAVEERIAAEDAAIATMLSSAESSTERLEADLSRLQEEGRFGDAAKLVAKLADARVDLRIAQDRKSAFERWKSDQEAEAKRTANDPLARFTPATRAWIEEHPRYLTDHRYQSLCNAADQLARAEGIPVDTGEYFRFVEDFVGEREEPARSVRRPGKYADEEDREPEEEPKGDGSRGSKAADKSNGKDRSLSTSAPPSRGSYSTTGERRGPRPLTEREKEAAKFSFPEEWQKDPREAERLYAESVVVLKQRGKL